MYHTPYCSDKRVRAAGMEQASQASQVSQVRHKPARSGYGAAGAARGGSSVDAGAIDLPMVAASVLCGTYPRQMQANIDAANQQLGNQAFLQWVGRLQGEKQFSDRDEVNEGGTQVMASPVSAGAPVQMQAKKDEKDNNKKPDNKHDPALPTLEAASFELADLAQDISDTDSDSDYEDETDELMERHFPAALAFYNSLTNRAEHIETEDHGALSLPGTGNLLATVMLCLLMVGVGLPLDIFTNLLRGMAKGIMLLSDVFMGKPATWLLNLYFKHYPPPAADRARVTSDTLPKGPPRGIDWNVSIPELVAISGISAYWQAGSTQSSLSPRLWLQPWTGGRIASIVFRTLVNDIVYLLQFTVFPQISRRVLQNRLGWSETRSGLFVSILNNIFDVVSSYILSYLTNLSLAVYLVFQNLIEDNELTPSEAAAAVVGYTALGMFIQTTSEAIFEYFVVSKVNEKNLVPWLNQFRAIPNRVVRTMAIALASFRNVIINVLSISLTTGQLSANIIGPLSTRFGEGGACFWPLAVAEVCGELPADFNQAAQDERIAAGNANMSFGQLFAIQLFPWLVGLIGLGVPIAYVISQYRKAKRSGRRANTAGLEECGLGAGSNAVMMGEDEPAVSVTSAAPEDSLASVEVHDTLSQPSVSGLSGAHPALTNLPAQMLFELLLRYDRLTPTELRRILRQHVDSGDITEEEAALIEEMVREEVVLSKER